MVKVADAPLESGSMTEAGEMVQVGAAAVDGPCTLQAKVTAFGKDPPSGNTPMGSVALWPACTLRFWEVANNETLAKERGVRAIHGDAPYMRMEPDRVYEVSLRSTGEVIITPGTRYLAGAEYMSATRKLR